RRRALGGRREDLDREGARLDDDDLAWPGQGDAGAREAGVLGGEGLDRDRVLAAHRDVGGSAASHHRAATSVVMRRWDEERRAAGWWCRPVRPVTRSSSTTTSWSV